MNRYFFSSLLMLAFLLAGCTQHSQLPTSNPLCTLGMDKADAMELTADILENLNFTIEKYDVEKGIISTKPLRGGQFFEPWRKDNIGADNIRLSNLHSIMRTVTVTVSQQSDQTCLDCSVAVRRLSTLERPIDGFGNLPSVFTPSRSRLQKLRMKRQYEWVDLADDQELEYAILQLVRNENEKS
ncbi:MAG: hypothetical protein KAS23_03820 [Anaerohalosphaera sp.]|nr:hypothetical protein [Anaerohalosphaera sp.]